MLVLFDIDSTLTTGSSCGRVSFETALHDVLGVPDALRDVSLHGNVDFCIVRDAAMAAGLWPDGATARRDLVERVFARYRDVFHARVGALPYRALEGAHDAIVAAREACELVGLATGNIESCGRAKLASAGLGTLLEGCVGGFGDEAEVRADVVRIAIARARAQGARAAEVLVVGDTPRDVAAAHEAGVAVAAVATGRFDRAALAEAGADSVYADLRALIAEPPWIRRTRA
jgi:phosphoglycolate phosphatase-like HAD superfamily hydrolase